VDGIIIVDANGIVLFANPAALSLFGRNEEELLGEYFGYPVLEEERTEIELLRNGCGSLTTEMRIVEIEWEGNPAYLASLRDITDRKRAAEALQKSNQKLRKALDDTVNALASAVESRDPYTAGHQQRVARLSCAIAKEMGLPDKQIEGIRLASLLHDVGKLYVPAEILSKPGKLNEAEMALVQKHPEVGYEILKEIEFPWPVAEIVLQHHERMQGDGYPSGMHGENILLEARILGVADVVEALLSHRPFRPALGVNKALEEITKYRGYYYDPVVVDVCVKIFEEKWMWINEEMNRPHSS
jgi:putative nucleotidyltransferase with HDIG domain